MDELRARAIKAVETYLATLDQPAATLPSEDLERYWSRFVQGWRVVRQCAGTSIDLNILLDAEFPFSLPRFALRDPPPELTWPHVEANGLLCLTPEGAAVSTESPDDAGRVLTSLLTEADMLLTDLTTGGLGDHFLDEFQSYWTRGQESGGKVLRSLLTISPGSREITLWRGERYYLVGDTPTMCERWLSHRNRQAAGTGAAHRFERAAYIWLEQPPRPPEYPLRTGSIHRLIATLSVDGLKVVQRLLSDIPDDLLIMLAAEWKGESVLAGLHLRKPQVYAGPGGGKIDSIQRGFRAAMVPAQVVASRYLGAAPPPTRSRVLRVDGRWLHGKDRTSDWDTLKGKRVCIIGCGSLGGGVARLLAQSGVGNLDLVDPDDLDWPNTTRHVLGGGDVGREKTTALAQRLREDFPHLLDVRSWSDRWQKLPSRDALLCQSDLLVCATGDWNSESALSDLQQESRLPPIVFGWLEEHATAGHALLLDHQGPCLRCGFTPTGTPLLAVTKWPTLLRAEGDCGAPYSPYGAAELAVVQSVVARTAIDALLSVAIAPRHAVWIGTRERLEAAGGKWSADWISVYGDPVEGGRLGTYAWQLRPNCSRHKHAS